MIYLDTAHSTITEAEAMLHDLAQIAGLSSAFSLAAPQWRLLFDGRVLELDADGSRFAQLLAWGLEEVCG